jgi:ubiquinol-cytochrome c reductase cytochrome b subunit
MITAWLEQRTGIPGALRRFLDEEIPGSCGWRQVFGSVALFLFFIQLFSGVLLSLNFSPAPRDAWYSVRYIVSEVTAGRMIRGLHHWTASAMIVVVVLHMIQTFLAGAYKKPREVTWIIGVVLLLFTLAFGLTGYLLPWDNRAYWGTVVTTEIAGKAPMLGPYLLRIMGAGSRVGSVTLTRFFALHVILFPLGAALLIGLHVFLVRKHGITPVADENKRAARFYPRQMLLDTVAIFVSFVAVFLLAALVDVPLGQIADPLDTSFVPRPDWYFLFLFQALKFFRGGLEPVGSILLPGLALLGLFLTPFIDRTRVAALRKRIVAISVVTLALTGWAALTWAAVASAPSSSSARHFGPNEWKQLPPQELAAHAKPGVPDYAIHGAELYQTNHCSSCHAMKGLGARVGPPLDGLAGRRDRDWVAAHFLDPRKLSPGSTMPSYRLRPEDNRTLTQYLLEITAP